MARKGKHKHNNIQNNPNVDTRSKKPTNKGKDYYLDSDPSANEFRAQLKKIGLDLREVPSDGNCLFSSLSDQLYGTFANHQKIREEAVEYIEAHRSDFEPFFDMKQIKSLRNLGTYGGHESIMATARLRSVYVVIHQLGQNPWLAGTPGLDIPQSKVQSYPQLHLAYHNGEHYTSVRVIGDTSNNPSNIKISFDIPNSSVRQESDPWESDLIGYASLSDSEEIIGGASCTASYESSSKPNRPVSDVQDSTSHSKDRTSAQVRKNLTKKQKRQLRRQSQVNKQSLTDSTEFIVESVSVLHM